MYNIQWTAEIVDIFWKEYWNQCRAMERLYHISRSMCYDWLRSNDDKWYKYKTMVKYYKKNVQTFHFQFDTVQSFRRKYQTFDKYCKVMLARIAYPTQREALDKQIYLDYS